MRITRETLLKIVQDTAARHARADRGLMAIYLSGSLLEDEYLLGGTADIDLFFIHSDTAPQEREVIPLSDDVHLDIAHHRHRDYRQPRSLRLHPWSGPTIERCKVVYDPGHFMDFTQASVRGQFERPDYVLERARRQLESARQTWRTFHEVRPEAGPQQIQAYLRALWNAANAIASLSGAPLTERRFLARFPERARAARAPGLAAGLHGLIGAAHVDGEALLEWLPLWEASYRAIPSGQASARLDIHRLAYYRKGIEAHLKSSQLHAALWPLLRTWTEAACLSLEEPETQDSWRRAVLRLELVGDAFRERVDGLDAFLDTVEEAIERWAKMSGADQG